MTKNEKKTRFRKKLREDIFDSSPKSLKKNGLDVLIITQGLSRLIVPLLNSKHRVVGILESAPRGYFCDKSEETSSYNFLNIIRSLYSKINPSKHSLKNKAKEANLPYFFMTSSEQPELLRWIKDLAPDVIVVYSMSQLLKDKIFSLPKFGTINLHPSMLPDYRGPNPDFWQYFYMEMNPGVSVHYIDKGEDTGDIIFQERSHIHLGIKSPQRLDKLIGEIGVSLVIKALDGLQNGYVPRIKQSPQSPTPRARNITLSEHKSIIDWYNWPIERIWHILRGTELWLNALPQPTGLWRGQRWEIENFDKEICNIIKPGNIGKKFGRYYVACSDGRIYLSRKFIVKNFIISLITK